MSKKPSSRKSAEKPAKSSRKAASKEKAGAKTPVKPTAKAAGAKAPAKPPSKPVPKPVVKATEKSPSKPLAKVAEPAKSDQNDKSRGKGITIVTPKPAKKVKVPVSMANVIPAGMGRLLDPKVPRKPLIPSGPKATVGRALGQHGGLEKAAPVTFSKSPLTPAQLEHFRQLLLRKRAELVGDVSMMEKEALNSDSGSLSNMPSHLAEQGSDASEQSVSLDLAAADRKLIREIDDALDRIERGTFGLCELTGKPIKNDRLEEIPWARHSIEAARELERHSMR